MTNRTSKDSTTPPRMYRLHVGRIVPDAYLQQQGLFTLRHMSAIATHGADRRPEGWLLGRADANAILGDDRESLPQVREVSRGQKPSKCAERRLRLLVAKA